MSWGVYVTLIIIIYDFSQSPCNADALEMCLEHIHLTGLETNKCIQENGKKLRYFLSVVSGIALFICWL